MSVVKELISVSTTAQTQMATMHVHAILVTHSLAMDLPAIV